jgi:hypothetical protein
MAGLTIEGADQLRRLAVKLRAADPKIKRELGASLRPSVKAITREIQDTVRSAPSSGRGRGGSGDVRRAARALARTRRISDYRAREIALKTGRTTEQVKAEHRAKQAAKAEAGAGLRESIARAVAGSISTSSARTGVSVTWKAAAAKMPNKQRRLPKDFNSPKGWRHPVFGNRENWVAQKGTPYFDVVIKKHREDLGQKVVEGMKTAADAILHDK